MAHFTIKLNIQLIRGPWSVRVADLNNDAKLDVVASSSHSNSVNLLLGNGDGTFQNRIGYTVNFQCKHLVVDDFNDDSKMDLAIATGGQSLIYFFNQCL